MNHKTKTYRILSWLLVMLMIVGLLPAQAFAAYTDDPTTWIAPDEQYTAPGSSPIYIYLDFSEDSYGHASHSCTSGAELSQQTVKATATTDGSLTVTCSNCDSWAKVNIPALTLDAFELDAAYRDAVENGVEYSGDVYTLVYNIRPEMRRFLGNNLENHVAIVMPGTYHILITVNSDIYDNVQLTTNETLTVYPKRIPWTATFANKIYDGVSLLDGVSVTYQDVEGSTVSAVLSACLVKLDGGEIVPDEAAPATQPIAAGPYAIGATITDEKYVWQVDGGTYRTVYTPVWIMPVASDIYVGETVSDVTLTTGGGSYTWTLDSSYSGFDSSRPGTTNVRATVSRTNGTQIGQVTVPVTVKARPIISVDPVTVNGSIGDAFSSLDLPNTVTVTAKGTNGNISVSGVPVTWDGSSYNSNLLTQTAPGTLRLTNFPQLSSENVPAFAANINLTYGSVVPPVVDPFSKVYDGNSTALPLPQMPTGVASASVRYKGASNAGVAYESNTPPVNAGSYYFREKR